MNSLSLFETKRLSPIDNLEFDEIVARSRKETNFNKRPLFGLFIENASGTLDGERKVG